VNFYNPIANFSVEIDDEIQDAVENGADETEAIIDYHLGEVRKAIQIIKAKDEVLAKAVADALMHGLLAVSAASHDIFATSQQNRDEDVATRIRKNR
jgi:hypothetical protein